MVLASFQVEDKFGKTRLFQKTFLLANINMEMVLSMPFFTFSNIDIQFAKKGLTWRSYTTARVLSTTKQVELIDRKEFAKAALNKNSEIFVTQVIFLAPISIYPDKKAQIASLLTKEVKISDKYSDFVNIFLEEKALVLLEQTEFNQHVIELEESKQPLYGPIYSLGPVELKTLKIYIKTHLKTEFIQPSKSFSGASILFDKKLDSSFRLYIDYWGLNNLTIKNQYLFSLINESLDFLS